MKVDNGLSSLWDDWGRVSSSSGRKGGAREVPTTVEDALNSVEAAKENMHNSTMKSWDDHTDMVKKSQQLRQIRDRKEAVERQSQERREDQTELMAQIAIENANRSKLLESQALERRAREMALVA